MRNISIGLSTNESYSGVKSIYRIGKYSFLSLENFLESNFLFTGINCPYLERTMKLGSK